MTLENVREAARDCPTAWFAAMERAIERGDLKLAAQAQAELDRLGYKVRPQNRRRPGRRVRR